MNMRPSKNEAIGILNVQWCQIHDLRSLAIGSPQFVAWEYQTKAALKCVFGQNCNELRELENALRPPRVYLVGGEKRDDLKEFNDGLDRAANLLQSMVQVVERFWAHEDLSTSTNSSVPSAKPAVAQPCDVFISYSHEDEELVTFLQKHLMTSERNGLIRKWWDRKIPAGGNVDQTIDSKLREADVILLCISSSFIASDYCFSREMQQAFKQRDEGRSLVVPIILRVCDWQIPGLSEHMALPRDGKAMKAWSDMDEAGKNIAVGLKALVADYRKSR